MALASSFSRSLPLTLLFPRKERCGLLVYMRLSLVDDSPPTPLMPCRAFLPAK